MARVELPEAIAASYPSAQVWSISGPWSIRAKNPGLPYRFPFSPVRAGEFSGILEVAIAKSGIQNPQERDFTTNQRGYSEQEWVHLCIFVPPEFDGWKLEDDKLFA